MMTRQLVCSELNVLSWEEHELPEPGPRELFVRNTHGAEKHGTTVAFLRGHARKRGTWDAARQMFLPGEGAPAGSTRLGNMQVGFVKQIGSGVQDFCVGDRVLYHGNFAPIDLVDESRVFKLKADTNWKTATCLDPAIYALCALRDGNIRVGDAVAIFSLGAIGLMAVQLAKLAGCYPIIAIDPLPNRREVATQTGADLVLNPMGADIGHALREATEWRGVDVVIEYSGSMEALQASLRGVAFGGNVVMGGFPNPMKAGLDLGAEAHMNRPNLIFSRTESDPSRDHPRWGHERFRRTAHRMIVEHELDGEPVVTPVLKYDDTLLANYGQIWSAPEKNIKLGVEY